MLKVRVSALVGQEISVRLHTLKYLLSSGKSATADFYFLFASGALYPKTISVFSPRGEMSVPEHSYSAHQRDRTPQELHKNRMPPPFRFNGKGTSRSIRHIPNTCLVSSFSSSCFLPRHQGLTQHPETHINQSSFPSAPPEKASHNT